MARIAIVGPGCIGGVAAAWLVRAGRHEVILCARRQLPEMEVTTPSGVIAWRPTVFTDPALAPKVDWVLVATKSYDAAASAAWFGGLCAGGAPVAILQNGVEHRERFSAYVPADRVIPTVVWFLSERTEPTKIVQRQLARLVVEDNALGREFGGLFAGTEIKIELTADLKTAAWRKLCGNSIGVFSPLFMAPAGIMRDEDVVPLAREIMRECVAVARAEGAILEDEIVENFIKSVYSGPANAISSIYADRLAGRQTEIDARNGVIVRLGEKHGIPTPYNRMAVALLSAMTRLDQSRRAQPPSGATA